MEQRKMAVSVPHLLANEMKGLHPINHTTSKIKKKALGCTCGRGKKGLKEMSLEEEEKVDQFSCYSSCSHEQSERSHHPHHHHLHLVSGFFFQLQ